MKTFNQEELSAMLSELQKVYKENNEVTVKLLDIRNDLITGEIRKLTRKDYLDLVESNIALCRIIHETVAKAESSFINLVPSLLAASKETTRVAHAGNTLSA